MLRQEEKQPTLPKVACTPRSRSKKRRTREGKNAKKVTTSTETKKENKHKLKHSTGHDMQRIDSGISGLTVKRSLKRSQIESSSQDADLIDISHDFEMLQLRCDDINEDSHSMVAITSRPSSSATLNLDEENFNRNFEDDSDNENLRGSETGKQRIPTAKYDQKGYSTSLGLDNSESPRLQDIKLEQTDKGSNKSENHNITSPNTVKQIDQGRESGPERKTKSKVKTAWELSDKFLLTTDFPADVWDEKKPRKMSLGSRRLSSDMLSESFPPLSPTVFEPRRGSFPSSPLYYSFSSPKMPSELPSLSGRQCKVQLPPSFPCVTPQTHESEPESSTDNLDIIGWEQGQIKTQIDRKLHNNYLDVPIAKQARRQSESSSSRASPNSSGSRSLMASSEYLAINAASTEYLAARVVTQLNCAFKETVDESQVEIATRENCVTPNLMPRRHSAVFFRPPTSNDFAEKAKYLNVPSIHEYSKSLPNLYSRDKTKRMFVTFDKDFPNVKIVDLKGKSDLAHKCRRINRRLANEDLMVKAMLEEKVHKKSLIKKWVVSSTEGSDL